MSELLLDVIYRIEPKESPLFRVFRHNLRRLQVAHGGMRARRRRVAKAKFRPADKRARFHEWINS